MGLTLVTGASGFVGSHLVEEMRRRGLPVRGITRGAKPDLLNIPSYGADMNWSDCLDTVDTVVHLAARVHVMQETASDPLSMFREANVTATINLARQAAEAGVRRFIFVSSIKVNGEFTAPGRPFTAAHPPNPQGPYGVSKAEAEAALMALGHETGMEITIIRPPLVYGPRVRGNFRSLAKWASYGLPSLFAAVNNKRSLVHVSNLCDLLIKVIDHPSAAYRIFLISDDRDYSTHELLETLAVKSGRRSYSVRVPPRLLKLIGRISGRPESVERLMQSLQVDIRETSQTLNWVPSDASRLDFY
ncbi:hypothetical protein ASE36_03535 [Rhizobium sp. Root274]|uniref:NAD-dependent epimerase/dehydratase family protein n=1 Tax=unclassified Rhizobium TaxID=2613769 RepID=UPI0007136690|nr:MULTISPECIES: NAD-dependent epimerase/dehydratase family protein [unclassified Rhizobium]KQW31343.1 hypothetical protein ASC71_03535 [Rhizobium sp. Root1240]KRD32887.1 hypothetical protein ASE36_03535 [Rhizobium sp. Root274]